MGFLRVSNTLLITRLIWNALCHGNSFLFISYLRRRLLCESGSERKSCIWHRLYSRWYNHCLRFYWWHYKTVGCQLLGWRWWEVKCSSLNSKASLYRKDKTVFIRVIKNGSYIKMPLSYSLYSWLFWFFLLLKPLALWFFFTIIQ